MLLLLLPVLVVPVPVQLSPPATRTPPPFGSTSCEPQKMSVSVAFGNVMWPAAGPDAGSQMSKMKYAVCLPTSLVPHDATRPSGISTACTAIRGQGLTSDHTPLMWASGGGSPRRASVLPSPLARVAMDDVDDCSGDSEPPQAVSTARTVPAATRHTGLKFLILIADAPCS